MVRQPARGGISPEQRFRRLYGAHHLPIYAYCRRRADPETASDATSETFLVAWRRIDNVPAGDGEFPWLLGVARRMLANQRRSQNRFLQLHRKLAAIAPDYQSTPEAVVVRESAVQGVLDALELLRPTDREVLRLAAWEGLSHEEIGVVLGCSAHAVSQRVHRAKQRLARALSRRRLTRAPVRRIERGGA